jgi:hypothetical protein
MERKIPFIDWFEEVESLLETINKCNFDVLDYAEDYTFYNLTISKPQPYVYKFKKAASADRFNPPPQPLSPMQIQPWTTHTVTVAGTATLSSSTLISFHVVIICTRDRIVKLQVVENWNQNFLTNDKVIHSIVFHDEDLLVNGKWYRIDSPEAFTHDLVEDDISVLALIDLFENFRKSA